MRNPAHFEIISSGRYFDHDRAAVVSRDNAELIGMTERMLAEAFASGALRVPDLKLVQIAGRALVYGFARMKIDGHFPRWGVADADVERTAKRSSISSSRASPRGEPNETSARANVAMATVGDCDAGNDGDTSLMIARVEVRRGFIAPCPVMTACDEGLFDADPDLPRLRYFVPRCS